MARRIIHQLVDDIDGTLLEPGSGETVLFSLDGNAYEIDLTDQNAKALRDAFARYIGVARGVSSGRGRSSGGGGSDSRTRRRSGQTDYRPIRAWAKDNGYKLSDRGRVPAAVIEAFNAAN